MILIKRKINKIKKYMSEKEKLVDLMLEKLKKLDNTIIDLNEKVGESITVLDNLNTSYDERITELNKKIDDNNKIRNTRVAVVLHLYYIDLWQEFKEYISNIHYDVDVYVNLVDGSAARLNLVNFKRKVEEEHANYKVFINENVGLDIGGSLYIIEHIIKEEKEYDYLLKMHSKKSIHNGRVGNSNGENWRNELLHPIVGDYKVVNDIIDIFTENPIVGMVGANKWLCDNNNNIYKDSVLLKTYMKNFKIDVPMEDMQYFGGTMFWVRYDIIKDFFTENDPIKIIRTFEKNSFIDNKDLKWTHAFERVLGLIVLNYGKKLIGV